MIHVQKKLLTLSSCVLIIALNSSCIGPPGPPGPPGTLYPIDPIFSDSWSGVTAGAATGYCLAKHPYLSNSSDLYTNDGYEKVKSPGIIGAVRRNYVNNRTTTENDQGSLQSCQQACREMGKRYEPSLQGQPLHQRLSDGTTITSGIGDMASIALPDHDFYTGRKNIAGMISRGNTYHENDVAQADYCCCNVTTSPSNH